MSVMSSEALFVFGISLLTACFCYAYERLLAAINASSQPSSLTSRSGRIIKGSYTYTTSLY
jgi:hypothetical protein